MNIQSRPLLLATLAYCLAQAQPLAAAPPTARGLPALMPAPEAVLQHAEELGLSAGQLAKLKDGMADLQTVETKFATQVQQQSDALAELLAHEKPDESAVTAQFEEVLAAESEVKRVRLAMSLRTRAALTAEQLQKLNSLGRASARRSASPKATSPEEQQLAAKMERMKALIERARQQGQDLSSMRAMWKRVNELTQDGKPSEAGAVLDEAANALEAKLAAPPAASPQPAPPNRRR